MHSNLTLYLSLISFPEQNYVDASNESSFSETLQEMAGSAGPVFDTVIVSEHEDEDALENYFAKRRRKRSATGNEVENNEYTMEILVAVDKRMQEYHGDEIKNYVLTLMSIVSDTRFWIMSCRNLMQILHFPLQVSNIFADASIGNSISIAVVEILLLKQELAHDSNGIGKCFNHPRAPPPCFARDQSISR